MWNIAVTLGSEGVSRMNINRKPTSWLFYLSVVKDQTRAIIQPMKVHPARTFTSTMPSIFFLCLTAANMVGRKYNPNPSKPKGSPMKGKPKGNQTRGLSQGDGAHEVALIATKKTPKMIVDTSESRLLTFALSLGLEPSKISLISPTLSAAVFLPDFSSCDIMLLVFHEFTRVILIVSKILGR